MTEHRRVVRRKLHDQRISFLGNKNNTDKKEFSDGDEDNESSDEHEFDEDDGTAEVEEQEEAGEYLPSSLLDFVNAEQTVHSQQHIQQQKEQRKQKRSTGAKQSHRDLTDPIKS